MRTGHHEVQEFRFTGDGPWVLPDGWKPFQTHREGNTIVVTASLWVHNTKVDALAWAEAITKEAAQDVSS